MARQILQLYIIGIPNEELGLQGKQLPHFLSSILSDKTDIFLELYGNSLIREGTEKFLEEIATKLIK